jgi:hypothetical protein
MPLAISIVIRAEEQIVQSEAWFWKRQKRVSPRSPSHEFSLRRLGGTSMGRISCFQLHYSSLTDDQEVIAGKLRS